MVQSQPARKGESPVPHDNLVSAIKAFLVHEPGIEETQENKEVFELINKYFNPAYAISDSEVEYLYKKLDSRLKDNSLSTLAEEYIEDLELTPFVKYDNFSFNRWFDGLPQDESQGYNEIWEVVDRSKAFREFCAGSRPPKGIQYIAAALYEKGIVPSVARDRLYALTDGSRVHAEASGLLGGEEV
ncbi:hypothetical protein ONZ45_g5534 [Pleurotus djamor]|nr:hypothetical protein ONZ45_g5534 [Pleurotus djamor]